MEADLGEAAADERDPGFQVDTGSRTTESRRRSDPGEP
jgi:hypothetical protein